MEMHDAGMGARMRQRQPPNIGNSSTRGRQHNGPKEKRTKDSPGEEGRQNMCQEKSVAIRP